MSLSSMTGYASAAGGDGEYRWTWEIKSVNGRGLDVRCRLPPTLEGLEPQVRSRLQARFRRGSVTAVLTLGAFTLLDLLLSRRQSKPAKERAYASARDAS